MLLLIYRSLLLSSKKSPSKDSVLLGDSSFYLQRLFYLLSKQSATPRSTPPHHTKLFLSIKGLPSRDLSTLQFSFSALHLCNSGSNHTDLFRLDGAFITCVAQLSMNDEQAVTVNTDGSGSYSIDTNVERNSFTPSTER